MLSPSEAAKKETLSHKTKRVKRHIEWHYYSRMPQRKLHRIIIWVVFLLYAGIIGAQMLYPLDRALPRASVAGEPVGYKKHEELAGLLNKQFDMTTITIVTQSQQITYPLKQAGAELATESIIQKAEDYPFWQRFLPLSILWQPVQITRAEVDYSPTVLTSFTGAASKKLTAPPVNAGLTIKNGALKATEDAPGISVTAADISAAIVKHAVVLGKKNVVHPVSNIQPAQTTSADFVEVKQQANNALARGVVMIADGAEFQPDARQRASWLAIGLDDKKQPTLQFSQVAFNKYLDIIEKQHGIAAGLTRVTLTDGNETARVIGTKGRAITREPLLQAVQSWLITGQGGPTFTVRFHDIPPMVIYNNIYTATQAGLQAYLNDVAKQMDVRVAIQQVGGAGWSASVRANESLPSASTYKLFIAKWLFTQMDAGKIKWDDPILDTNVTTCFDRMTIASTNPCAEEWIRQAGRTNLNNFVYGLGFSGGTSFTNPIATHTTPSDLRKYMLGLQNGSLVGGAYRDRLLHSLISHPYRTGIPGGSNGTVYDKVGFLWDYVHDAAIVYHPRGTYVMVVMTKGQSYATIATITRQVERIMYP